MSDQTNQSEAAQGSKKMDYLDYIDAVNGNVCQAAAVLQALRVLGAGQDEFSIEHWQVYELISHAHNLVNQSHELALNVAFSKEVGHE